MTEEDIFDRMIIVDPYFRDKDVDERMDEIVFISARLFIIKETFGRKSRKSRKSRKNRGLKWKQKKSRNI